jgi:hypothetical protein
MLEAFTILLRHNLVKTQTGLDAETTRIGQGTSRNTSKVLRPALSAEERTGK